MIDGTTSMIRKTVEFSTPGTRLSVAHRQLVVERDMPKATLPIENLGVVIVDDVRATYTQAVFLELLAAAATVMVTGWDHLPAGMMLPSVFHSNRSNPFCLADDLLEPYRPYVDWRVRFLMNEAGIERPHLIYRAVRAALLSLFQETVLVSGRRNPMLLAIKASAASPGRALTRGEKALALPQGLPLDPDLLDGDGAD
jgi:CRISPR/Cas system-associated endonuclease Cas1